MNQEEIEKKVLAFELRKHKINKKKSGYIPYSWTKDLIRKKTIVKQTIRETREQIIKDVEDIALNDGAFYLCKRSWKELKTELRRRKNNENNERNSKRKETAIG